MVQSSQQYVAPYRTGVEWGLGPIALRIVAAIWAGIPVEVTQETGVVPRRRRAAIGKTILVASYDTQENGGRILLPAQRGND